MKPQDIDRLIDRLDFLRRPCDLDLLLFFARHPRTLLASEQIAAFVGYELAQIAESLEVLLAAGLLTRRQNPTHEARLYAFTGIRKTDGSLPPLLRLGSTRTGRLELLRTLTQRADVGTRGRLKHAQSYRIAETPMLEKRHA